VDEHDGGGLGFHPGVTDEGFCFAVAVFERDPLEVTRGFFEAGLGPVLGGGGEGERAESDGEGEQALHNRRSEPGDRSAVFGRSTWKRAV